MEFKDRMKLLREEANLTQDELAQKLEITKAAISNYETGRRKPDYELLEKIGDFFNVDLLYLFGKQDKKKADSKSVCAQAHVGSNPTLSAKETAIYQRMAVFVCPNILLRKPLKTRQNRTVRNK